MSASVSSLSTWSPLRRPVFRSLWIASVVSNTGTWMQDLGAGWLMTSLTDSAFEIALVQASVTAPVFLLAMIAGALADILDRRRYLLGAYGYLAVVTAIMGLITALGWMTADTLLVMTFAVGVGLALTLPGFASILPELVGRDELPSAVILNSISMNVSRTLGPAIGGVLIAWVGAWLVFVTNAITFLVILIAVLRWRRDSIESTLPSERIIGALRAGLRYAASSPGLIAVLVRGATFFLFASALLALLPLVARDLLGGGATTYGWLLAAMGIGAVTAAVVMPWVRQHLTREQQVRAGSMAMSLVLLAMSEVRSLPLTLLLLFIGGMAWVNAISSLQTAGQLCLPSWVRARGLSVMVTAYMGGMAGGAALWGHIADLLDVPSSFALAAGGGLIGLLLTRNFEILSFGSDDLAPAEAWPIPTPVEQVSGDRGPVMITVEYQIDPTRAREFSRIMREMRRIRTRNGAISWGLFADTGKLGRYLEYFMVMSWLEHKRFSRRITVFERKVMDAVHAFHEGEDGPLTRHYIAQSLPRD
jgi:MFS family permease